MGFVRHARPERLRQVLAKGEPAAVHDLGKAACKTLFMHGGVPVTPFFLCLPVGGFAGAQDGEKILRNLGVLNWSEIGM